MLGRVLPPAPDKLPHPDGPATVPAVTCASPALPIDLWHSSCRAFRNSPGRVSENHRDTSPSNRRLLGDRAGRFSSTLAALLRTTGLAAEHLTHSLCTAPLPLLDIPPPHVSSVKWKSCPIKKRQPGADHGRTYANVDTAKYHTRREGKKSLRGKQIG